MFRSVLHLLLALNILASSVGITVMERACNMEGKKRALLALGEEGGCGHAMATDQAVASCCAKAAHKPGRTELKGAACCEVKALSTQASTNAPVPTTENTLTWTPLVAPPVSSFVLDLPAPADMHAEADFMRGHAPPNGQAIRILLQSFRC
jgi:hypothetical protein